MCLRTRDPRAVAVQAAPSADPTAPKAVRAATGVTFTVTTLALDDPADAYPAARLVAPDERLMSTSRDPC